MPAAETFELSCESPRRVEMVTIAPGKERPRTCKACKRRLPAVRFGPAKDPRYQLTATGHPTRSATCLDCEGEAGNA